LLAFIQKFQYNIDDREANIMDEYRIKPWEDLTIQDDYMFKLIMSYPHICKRMIEKILQIPIKDIKYIDEEKSIKARYTSKGVRLDVYVEDKENTVYDIEMQVRKPEGDGLDKRLRYYQSMIDADQTDRGKDYDELKKTYIIFICPFPIMNEGRHKFTFRNRCDEDKNIILKDGAVKILLSTKGTMNDVEPDVKKFLDYVNGILSNDEFVQEIDQEIKEIKKDKKKGLDYMTYEMKIREERKEGYRKGQKEGYRKGQKETEMKVALTGLRKGMSLSDIIEFSNLTEPEIRNLAEQEHITIHE